MRLILDLTYTQGGTWTDSPYSTELAGAPSRCSMTQYVCSHTLLGLIGMLPSAPQAITCAPSTRGVYRATQHAHVC
jgi:hypothetical protein